MERVSGTNDRELGRATTLTGGDSALAVDMADRDGPIRSAGDARTRPRLAIVIAHGPEVRALIHSGLVSQLAATNDVTILTSHPGSAAFRRLPRGVDVRSLPGKPAGNAWRDGVLRLHRAWLEARGRRKWTHRLPRGRRGYGPKQRILRRLATDRVLGGAVALERAAGRALGTDRDVARCFEALGIELVLACSYNSARVRPLLQTARNLGIPAVVVANSWKDVFVQSHVSVSLSRLLLRSERDVAEFAGRNPFFPRDRIMAVGSLHLEALARAELLSREMFCARYGLEPERSIVCYTAAAPQAAVGEIDTVRELARRLRDMGPRRPQLLIRANPMEDGSRFIELVAASPDMVLQHPEWEWIEESDWCCSLESDLRLWASTIAHSAANVSIPSTVTLEFLSRRKPVFNVCFDPNGMLPSDRSAKRFWDAEFYRPIRDRPGIHGALSMDQLLDFLGAELRAPVGRRTDRPEVGHGAVDRLLAALDGTRDERARA